MQIFRHEKKTILEKVLWYVTNCKSSEAFSQQKKHFLKLSDN